MESNRGSEDVTDAPKDVSTQDDEDGDRKKRLVHNARELCESAFLIACEIRSKE